MAISCARGVVWQLSDGLFPVTYAFGILGHGGQGNREKNSLPMALPSRDYRQRTLCGSNGLRKGSPLSLMLIQGGDDTCRYKKVPYPLKNGGDLASLYFFPEFAKNRTWITRKMRFPAFLANNRLSTPVNQKSKGVVLNEREKTAIDAMRPPAICFTQVFSRIVRANHEKSLPRILHIQIFQQDDFPCHCRRRHSTARII